MSATIEVRPVRIADDRKGRSVVTFKTPGGGKVIVTFPFRSQACSAFNAKSATITVAWQDAERTLPAGIDLTHLQPGLTSMPPQPGNWEGMGSAGGCVLVDGNGTTVTPLPCRTECPKFAIGAVCEPAPGDPCQAAGKGGER